MDRREFIRAGAGLAGIIAVGKAPAAIVKSLVGANGICFAGNANEWVNPYVTDGLIAMWDGEWNAGNGVHDDAATIWKDLVGNDDLLATDGAFFGANFADCAYGKTGPAQFIGNSFHNDNLYYKGIVIDIVVESNFSKNTHLFRTHASRFWQGLGTRIILGAERYSTPALRLSSGVQKYHITIDCINVASYINGLLYTSSARDSNTFRGNHRIEIGPQNSSYYGGKIYRVSLYNRPLSEDEIMHNHLVDKERFGL